MSMDKIKVAEWFRTKPPSLARCKERDLPLLNFSNLTCMEVVSGSVLSKPCSTTASVPMFQKHRKYFIFIIYSSNILKPEGGT